MDAKKLQVNFLERIIKKYGGNKIKISKEIAGLLNISGNVIYDRLSGKKLLNIEELYILSQHYKVAISDMISPTATGYNLNSLQKQPDSFDEYLNMIYVDLKQLAGLDDCKIFYIASETPFFYYLFHPNVALFKMFVWGRTVWNIPHERIPKFNAETLNSPETERLMSELLQLYVTFETNEFWSITMIDTTINQIKHCLECKLFEDVQDAFSLIDDLKGIINKMESIAISGNKMGMGSSTIFNNELIQSSTIILVQGSNIRGVYLVYDAPNFMISYDEKMYQHTYDYHEKIKKSSFYLGEERQRIRFFEVLRRRVVAAETELRQQF